MSNPHSTRVLIYVQHLLGVGHLQRAVQLAAAVLQRGYQVQLVSGGMPVRVHLPQQLQLHQLPPLYSADGSFTQLLDVNGDEIDDRWREIRKQSLLDIFDAYAPQVLITETFPFGRRMLRFELMPLLQASRASADCKLVIASIRDILQPRSNPERDLETCELIDTYYDRVLVHGDKRIARLEDSFAQASRIEDKLYYSGYICAQGAHSVIPLKDRGEVLVSAGGSDTGLEILQTAIAAKPLSSYNDLQWRILVSPAIDQQKFEQLQRDAGPGVHVERNRSDFSERIKCARLSISQAGYNTMTDLLNSDTPAVVIPFAEANEKEQTLRAEALQAQARLVALNQAALTPAALAAAMSAAVAGFEPLTVDLEGAASSAAMIAQWQQDIGVAR